MKTNIPQIQISEFVDLVALPSKLSSNQIFDLIIEDEININNYCAALIDKVCILNNTSYYNFIDYQCFKVKNPILFLDKFEELIANNENIFALKCKSVKINLFYGLLEKKRNELESKSIKDDIKKIANKYINAESEDRHFSYVETKKYVDNMINFNEKILFLTEEIFEYRQADLFSKHSKLLEYDTLCEQLILKLQTLRKMIKKNQKLKKEEVNNTTLESKPIFKLKLNDSINILTDVYKQMMVPSKITGKPYLDFPIKKIAEFICENHLDENGNVLSYHTIRTYLSTTRNDKGPNNDNKIHL